MEVDGIRVHQHPETDVLQTLDCEYEIALDLETSGLDPWSDKIHVLSIYGPESGTLYVGHYPNGKLPKEWLEFFERPRRIIAHNSTGFDALFLAQYGIDVLSHEWYDTLIGEAASVLSGRRDISVSLKASIRRHLGMDVDKEIEHTWGNASLTHEQWEYAARDVLLLPRLKQAQMEKVKAIDPSMKVLQIEMRLIPVTLQMTLNGMPIDLGLLRADIEIAEAAAKDAAGSLFNYFGEINLRSPIQLRKAFQALGVPQLESTDYEHLSRLGEREDAVGEAAQLVLAFRKGDQRRKVYTFPHPDKPVRGSWVEKHVKSDYRVHTKFWQLGADTGRYTSSDPNMQQIPKDLRYVFGNEEGYEIVSADARQIEVWTQAYLSKDDRLLEACRSSDIHTAVASGLFRVPMEGVSTDQRQLSKAVTFTLIFGGAWQGIQNYARMYGVNLPDAEAKNLRTMFLERFPKLAARIQRANDMAAAGNPVTIILPTGLRRTLAGPTLTGTRILNTSVQGTAAAGLKFAKLEGLRRGLSKYYISTVHDEQVARVPVVEVKDYKVELNEAMLEGYRQALGGLEVEIKVVSGKAWQ